MYKHSQPRVSFEAYLIRGEERHEKKSEISFNYTSGAKQGSIWVHFVPSRWYGALWCSFQDLPLKVQTLYHMANARQGLSLILKHTLLKKRFSNTAD